MRKKLKLILIILIIGIFSLLIYGISARASRIKNLEKRILSLPEFSFNTIDGQVFKSESIKSGPVLIAYYHPECEHCRYEINELFNNLKQIPDTKILLISFAQRDSIIAFIGERINYTDKNVFLLIDDSLKFINYFQTNAIPSTFIYDKELKLKRIFRGEVKPEAIINLLKVND